MEIELLREIFIPKQGSLSGDRLSFDQSYALNDFHFDGDPVYGDNRIAGIPIHVYEAQLLTKARLVSVPAQTSSVIFRVIQLMRRTRSLRIAMYCLVSVRDFDETTDSQSLSIAGP